MASGEHHSRRWLVGSAAAGLALAPALMPTWARAGTGSLIDSDPPRPTTSENVQGAADGQNHMTVEAWLNDKGPFRFVVDTGADRSVIADDVAATLGLTPGKTVIVQGIARAVEAPAVHLDSLRFGRVHVDSLPMPVLPRALLGVDGYLGLDVIDRNCITFDFRRRRLTVTPSDRLNDWVSFTDTLVRVAGDNGRLTAIDSRVDGCRAHAFIDSGAQMSIANTRLFAELQKNGANYASDEVVEVVGVTGGGATGRVARVGQVRLGPLSFGDSTLLIADLPVFDVWGLGDKPALFIGMNFLRQTSSFTIDYGRKELRFKLAQIMVASRA